MSGQTPLADHPIDADYEAIRAAVMETARGRWFLGEHARRNRHAETSRLLVLLEEIRAAVQKPKTPAAAIASTVSSSVLALSSVATGGRFSATSKICTTMSCVTVIEPSDACNVNLYLLS